MFMKVVIVPQFLLLLSISSASRFLSKFNLPGRSSLRPVHGKECAENYWKCPGENKCLKISQMCDGNYDCQQGDDERIELCTKDFCLNELDRWKCPGDSKVFKILK